MSQTLKLSPETVAVLRNFSAINKSIYVRPGNRLVTMAETKSIIGIAEVQETFEVDFSISELSKFLSVLSVFEDPDLTIDEKRITISEGKNKLNYTLTDKRAVLTVEDESIEKIGKVVDKGEVEFTLTHEAFQGVDRARSILKLPEYLVQGDEVSTRLVAIDTSSSSSDSYEKVVGDAVETPFRAVFRQENFKFLPKDYGVKYSSRGLARFTGDGVTYFVTAEARKS